MEHAVVRSGSRTRICLTHDPAFVVGLIFHRRAGRRTLRAFAREVARRINAFRDGYVLAAHRDVDRGFQTRRQRAA